MTLGFGVILLIINIVDFGNKTPWNFRHIIHQSGEKGLHTATTLLHIGQTKIDLILTYSLFVSFLNRLSNRHNLRNTLPARSASFIRINCKMFSTLAGAINSLDSAGLMGH